MSWKWNCQGKLGYRGPLAPRAGGLPRIKLDLTADERVVLAPVRLPVFHSYADGTDVEFEALAYSYEEAFAEKVRALAERTRPRDLYDVVNLFRNSSARPAAAVLPDFFDWLRTGATPEEPLSYALADGEYVVYEHTLRLPLHARIQSHLEIIRFCAANRLCVLLKYGGKTRTIEPYSLRRTKVGDFLIHAWNTDANQHRAYYLDRIEGASITTQSFSPRYLVELTPESPFTVPRSKRRERRE